MFSMLTVFRKEWKCFFLQSFGFHVLAVSLFVSGFFFLNLLSAFRIQVAQAASLPVESLASALNLNQGLFTPYFQTLGLLVIFILPLLAARSITEERAYGTRELFMLSGSSAYSVVLGKYLACLCFYVLLLLLSASYVFFVALQGNSEILVICSGLLGLFLFGACFLAIAFAIASLHTSVSSAALSGILVLFLFYLIHIPAESFQAQIAWVLESLSPKIRLSEMLGGEIRLSALCYFVGMILLGMVCTALSFFPHLEAPQVKAEGLC